jgi:DUF4097 and DUF4098 domain-containing protein YvlB
MNGGTMTYRLATLFVAVLAGGIAVPLPAQFRDTDRERCDANVYGRHARAKFCEEREFGMRPVSGSLTIDGGRNGGVDVVGWDRDSIHVIAHIEVNADSPEEARSMAGEIKLVHSAGDIHAEGPGSGRRTGWAVSFEIMVPRHSDLQITTANGPAGVEEVFGKIDVESENGPIALVGAGGDVKARAENGPLSIRLAGSKWDGAGLDAETVNGPVSLRIPRDYSARLETGTVNGPFDLESPMTVTFQGRHFSRITSVLGSGGAPVRAVTTNGPVDIHRN